MTKKAIGPCNAKMRDRHFGTQVTVSVILDVSDISFQNSINL